jgi:hypothetical protein
LPKASGFRVEGRGSPHLRIDKENDEGRLGEAGEQVEPLWVRGTVTGDGVTEVSGLGVIAAREAGELLVLALLVVASAFQAKEALENGYRSDQGWGSPGTEEGNRVRARVRFTIFGTSPRGGPDFYRSKSFNRIKGRRSSSPVLSLIHRGSSNPSRSEFVIILVLELGFSTASYHRTEQSLASESLQQRPPQN